MRDKLYAAINNAIDNSQTITLMISYGSFCGNICIIPDAFDIKDTEMIVYSGDTFIIFTIDTVIYNDIDEAYVVSGRDSTVMIVF